MCELNQCIIKDNATLIVHRQAVACHNQQAVIWGILDIFILYLKVIMMNPLVVAALFILSIIIIVMLFDVLKEPTDL